MKNNKLFLTILAIATLAGNNALAATATGTMQVNTSVAATCNVVTAPIAFGTFTERPGLILSNAATNPVRVTCTKGTTYTVGLSAGSSGSATDRTMVGTKTGNTDKLKYFIYNNLGRTIVMTETGTGTLTDVGTGEEVVTNLYPSISGNQYATPDSYSDTLTLTVTY